MNKDSITLGSTDGEATRKLRSLGFDVVLVDANDIEKSEIFTEIKDPVEFKAVKRRKHEYPFWVKR
jgi:hypothetical protein